MDHEKVPPEFEMMKHILGKWISKPVHVAAKLGIADILAGGEKHAGAISEITKTNPDALYRMMRALAGVGIFTETRERVFANTPLSECLMEGRLRSAALLFHSDWHDKVWDNLFYTIKTGKPSFEKVHGQKAFEWFGKNPEAAEVFHKANSHKAAFSHSAIVETRDFSEFESITDVGGGLGGLMFAILDAFPNINGTVFELPETARHLETIIRDRNMEKRLQAIAGNFFREIPGGSDAYLLSNILHDWPDRECETILKNCRKAVGPNGRLLIVETLVPPGNAFSIAKLLDLEVLLMGGGRERTEAEYETLLANTGFHLSGIVPTREGISVIEGIPL